MNPTPKFLATRRAVIGAGAALAFLGRRAAAEGDAVSLGMLVPLTGFSGLYGQAEAKVGRAVIDEVNAAGGIKGRRIALTIEDDQSNTDATVRGARKLIDVDKVAAIMATYASAGAMAIAPLCSGSQTFITTTAGADSVTQLDNKGFLLRTQPNTTLQGRKFGEYAVSRGARRVQFVSPQTPFAQSEFDALSGPIKAAGGDTRTLIYDDKKPSYRTEVDEVLRFQPDAVIFGGYAPDTAVMLKEFYRAGFKGAKIAFGYAVNEKMLATIPHDVAEGVVSISPSPEEGSPSYARLAKLTQTQSPDYYQAQVYDQVNLVILALAAANGAAMDGLAIRDGVRKVSNSPDNPGEKVTGATDGIKLLADGKRVSYQGASGPCIFTPTGDITDCKFRYDEIKDGKPVLLRIE